MKSDLRDRARHPRRDRRLRRHRRHRLQLAAGATFGYQLLWAVVIGVGGIITYAEMCGRVAAVSETAVFDAVRERLGFSVGLVTLVAGQLVNLLTLAAEVGGVALALQLLVGLSVPGAARARRCSGSGSCSGRCRSSGSSASSATCGLCAARVRRRGDQAAPGLGRGRARLRPSTRHRRPGRLRVLRRRADRGGDGPVRGLLLLVRARSRSAGRPKDLGVNRANAIIGYSLGGILSFALMISAGALLLPQRDQRRSCSAPSRSSREAPLGQIGLILALSASLFAVSGAAIDSAFSGAYNVAQFFGWEWGKYRHNAGAPRFTLAWMVMLVARLR